MDVNLILLLGILAILILTFIAAVTWPILVSIAQTISGLARWMISAVQ